MSQSADREGGPRRFDFLDVCVHQVTMASALATLDGFARTGGPHHVVTLDASMCVAARADSELREIVRGAELVTPDSAGVLWAARRFGIALEERVSGVEIVAELAARSAQTGMGIYLLGAAPGVAEEAAARLRSEHSGCRIVGTGDGYFGPDEEPSVVAAIRAAAPDALCVALGIPKQEKWIAHHRDELGVPIMIGVGGTFDVMSGRTRRAPGWMRRTNLEWLYRVLANPRKLGKVMTLPVFVGMVLLERRRARP
jgi:N-acetylglucosaminyldiphosphoundecaprenol N-acetyl-beta-D-mannosaminyltransferase